jgi:cellulose synthase/poly-beta-1,6-N-acetylglucosamine synthase-like glycosyltransferase
VFDALQGFDTRFNGVAGEDMDFWWRAQYAGYSTAFVPQAVVRVRYRDTLGSLAREAFRYGAAVPLLYRIHRVHGMPRRSLRRTVRQLAWVIVRSPRIFAGREPRGEWIWGSCNLLGRVRGAIRNRVGYV